MDISLTSDYQLMVDGKILPFTFDFMTGFYRDVPRKIPCFSRATGFT